MNPFHPTAKAASLRDKFALARKELSAALIERDEEVDLVLTALVANEHVLLVGPPGCGKSLLLDSVLAWTGGTRFTLLLTKFTTIEELMGPMSLAGLKEDRYARIATGKLPEADFSFIDELFKGSSAILNCLLRILNERTPRSGRRQRPRGAAQALSRCIERVALARDGEGVVGPVRSLPPAAGGRADSPRRSFPHPTERTVTMDPDELLKLLDLDAPARLPEAANSREATGAVAADSTASASPMALEIDEWGLRRGRDLVDESERLQRAGTDAFATADFFAAAFDPEPRLRPTCADARRHRFLAQLFDTPEYHALHAATRLDDTAAAIAAAHFAEQFAALRKEDGDRATSASSSESPGALGAEMATLRAVGRAVAEAGQEVAELHETTGALGMGPGMPGCNDPRAVAELFKRVRNHPSLRRICDLAGRFRRVAQSKQRMKTRHGLDDVVGIEPGGDVGRLLPAELARLMVPELELDALRRIAEREALCREHRAVEPVGKGPIIVVLDESGSMSGEKNHTAKALALALAWIARQQRRWCALVAFSGDSGERLLPLPPARWDEMKLVEWLGAFIGRGSTIDVPVREMPRMYADLKAPPGVTDLIFVTDAQCRLPVDVQQAFLTWKCSVGARLVTLVIDEPAGDLALISDEVHLVSSIAPESDAVGRVLSL